MKLFSVLALTAVLAVPCFANASIEQVLPLSPIPRLEGHIVAREPCLPLPTAGKLQLSFPIPMLSVTHPLPACIDVPHSPASQPRLAKMQCTGIASGPRNYELGPRPGTRRNSG